MIPFAQEFLYVTIECKDYDLLQDISMQVKATFHEVQARGERYDGDSDCMDVDTSMLDEFL